MKPESNWNIQGPVEVEIVVYITDGEMAGTATIRIRMGAYGVSPEDMRNRVEKFAKDEMPEGYRLMTMREFFDYANCPPSAEYND